jgi:hypothetical protein
VFPEKPTVEDDIFEEIDYTKSLVIALEKVDLVSGVCQVSCRILYKIFQC